MVIIKSLYIKKFSTIIELRFKIKTFITLLIILYIILLLYKINGKLINKYQNEKNKVKNYTIFFLESNFLRKVFTTKEMCAIESAAKKNPYAIVKVYSYSAILNDKANKLLKEYSNIKIIKFKPEEIFSNTPFLHWWLNSSVLKSPHSFAHIADAFRYVRTADLVRLL